MTGADTVASAIVAAKKAAKSIHMDLIKKDRDIKNNIVNYYYLETVNDLF